MITSGLQLLHGCFSRYYRAVFIELCLAVVAMAALV